MEWREEKLKQQLAEYHLQVENIRTLDRYDDCISEKVLIILLQWACYGQHIAGIMMGRKYLAEIPREWFKAHLLDVVKNHFEYSDDWNYRRLLEVVAELLPECKDEVLFINSKSTDPDLIEIINDFK